MTINWKNRSYTESEFRSAWQDSTSLTDVARTLNLSRSGGAYRIIKETATTLGLTRESSYVAQNYTYTLEEILVKNSPYRSTSNLRKRLVKEGVLDNRCSAPFCPLPDEVLNPFTGEKVEAPTLTLDHINGDNKDNRLDNLRILCQFCHAMTDTWCGRGKIRRTGTGDMPTPPRKIGECGHEVNRASTMCIRCFNASRKQPTKIDWPDLHEMVTQVQETSYSAYSKVLGVSDNSVRKHFKRNGLDPKSLSMVQ